MNFEQLVRRVQSIHSQLAQPASKAVNLGLTLRNWLIGCHLQEYELRGEDRSQYGAGLFDVLADRLTALGLPNCNRRQVYRYLDFYRSYPQIVGTLSPLFRGLLPARVTRKKVGTASPQSAALALPADRLVEVLSYSHFEQPVALEDPLKRVFCELECARGEGSSRRAPPRKRHVGRAVDGR